ncbi:MAG: vesicle formation at the endoplasmic reticulum [Geoglossum simile]|nr:MAG: vesicle formation at the endoplasmic reticulum [Geoglossum simile]
MLSLVKLLAIWSAVGQICSLQAMPIIGLELFEHLPAVPSGWTWIGMPLPTTQIQLRIALQQGNTGLFEQALLDVSTPDHPRYGKHLKRDEVHALLRPAENVITSVLGWLDREHIPVSDINHNGDWIMFNVTVQHANTMLNASFRTYHNVINGQRKIRTLRYSVPKSLRRAIVMIQPTTRFGQVRPQRTFELSHSILGDTSGTTRLAGQTIGFNFTACNETISPQCLKELYNVKSVDADPKNGNKLGIAGFLDQYAKFDALETFLSKYAPYAIGSNLTVTSINGGRNDQNSTIQDSEANLDVQYGISMSYPVPAIYYTTGGLGPLVPDLDEPTRTDNTNEPYLDFLHYMLALDDCELPQTLTTSYGEDEQSVPEAYSRTVCTMYAQLGARGVSVIFSSGDTGAGSACLTNDGKNTTRFLPIFPASCPWVTSVGGTSHIHPEEAVFFSSGGFSDRFPRPKYQDEAVKAYLANLGEQWRGLYNPEGRGSPDVAAQSMDFRFIDYGKDALIAGTSAAAPTFAAIISLLNSLRLSSHQPSLGFLNPWLYSTATSGFNDITAGGSRGCTGKDPFTGLPTPFVEGAGWNATAGWDPVTGLGTPDFGRLRELVNAA